MNFTAAFVEYLVTGCTALLWIIPLLWGDKGDELSKFPGGLAILLLPILYALGSLIDFVSYYLVWPMKSLIRKEAKEGTRSHRSITKEEESVEDAFPSLTVATIAFSSELGKELIVRNSRERIARGTLLNLLLLSVVIGIGGAPSWLPLPVWVPILLTLLGFVVWAEFALLAQRYKYNAFRTLQRLGKLSREDGQE